MKKILGVLIVGILFIMFPMGCAHLGLEQDPAKKVANLEKEIIQAKRSTGDFGKFYVTQVKNDFWKSVREAGDLELADSFDVMEAEVPAKFFPLMVRGEKIMIVLEETTGNRKLDYTDIEYKEFWVAVKKKP